MESFYFVRMLFREGGRFSEGGAEIVEFAFPGNDGGDANAVFEGPSFAGLERDCR